MRCKLWMPPKHTSDCSSDARLPIPKLRVVELRREVTLDQCAQCPVCQTSTVSCSRQLSFGIALCRSIKPCTLPNTLGLPPVPSSWSPLHLIWTRALMEKTGGKTTVTLPTDTVTRRRHSPSDSRANMYLPAPASASINRVRRSARECEAVATAHGSVTLLPAPPKRCAQDMTENTSTHRTSASSGECSTPSLLLSTSPAPARSISFHYFFDSNRLLLGSTFFPFYLPYSM